MKTEKVCNVLQALHKDRIDTLTKEALVRAFNDDGIMDLEGVAEHMLKRIKKDIDIQRTEPHLIDFAPLGKRTPQDAARSIIHVAPEVPFILDGVQYDPREIRRFDGRALIFMPVVAADGSDWLQLFPEEVGSTLASYFQMRQLEKLMQVAGFIGGTPTPPGFPPSGGIGPGQPTGDIPYLPLNPPGTSGPQPSTPAPQPPAPHYPDPPITWNQIQMFDGGAYSGNWFWLAKGFMYADLTGVSRGGWFGGDWNDEIWSLSSTNTPCIYCEHVQLQGSKLFLVANKPIPLLSALGWSARISSVWNFDM